jgi:hypothetical protein
MGGTDTASQIPPPTHGSCQSVLPPHPRPLLGMKPKRGSPSCLCGEVLPTFLTHTQAIFVAMNRGLLDHLT